MKQLLTVFSILLVSKFSYAGLVFEPYLGYQMGAAKTTTVSGNNTTDSKDKGTVIGARVGYSFLVPWVALDYSMYSGKDDGSPESDLKQTNLGVAVGVQMIPLVRPYAGYILSAKNESDNGTGAVTVKGTGMKVGIGLKILPLVNINIEYAKYDYKDLEGVGSYTSVSDVFSDFQYTTTTIGLSYVF